MNNDRKDIEAVLQTYFDGVYENDPKKIAQVFHECSHLYSVTDGKLNDLSRDAWFERMAQNQSAQVPGACPGMTGSSRSSSPVRRPRSPR
jgi:hypothetical protein